ncbi:unnamed protein product [Lactuca saligna]|uniref:Uncharacterized protein n=1 Tax=Lactuca saligna TaxID=75948 RepID=A0AA35YYR3_LACSI|nr:unnamed protein product [Lactuca saligna]
MHATFNLIICYKEKQWDIEQLVGSGGMPSSYSATVTALASTVGFLDDSAWYGAKLLSNETHGASLRRLMLDYVLDKSSPSTGTPHGKKKKKVTTENENTGEDEPQIDTKMINGIIKSLQAIHDAVLSTTIMIL